MRRRADFTTLPPGLALTYPGRPHAVDIVSDALTPIENSCYNLAWNDSHEEMYEGEPVRVWEAGYSKVHGQLREKQSVAVCRRTVERLLPQMLAKGLLHKLPKKHFWKPTRYVVRRYVDILALWRRDATIAQDSGEKTSKFYVIGRARRFLRTTAAVTALGIVAWLSLDAWGVRPRARAAQAEEARLPDQNPARVTASPTAAVRPAPGEPRPPPSAGLAVAVPPAVAGAIRRLIREQDDEGIAQAVRAARLEAEGMQAHIPDQAIAQLCVDLIETGSRVRNVGFFIVGLPPRVRRWVEMGRQEQAEGQREAARANRREEDFSYVRRLLADPSQSVSDKLSWLRQYPELEPEFPALAAKLAERRAAGMGD